MRVGREISAGPKALQFEPKPRKMRGRWLGHVNVRQSEPSRDSLSDIGNRKRMSDNPPIGRQANEAQQCRPREPHRFWAT